MAQEVLFLWVNTQRVRSKGRKGWEKEGSSGVLAELVVESLLSVTTTDFWDVTNLILLQSRIQIEGSREVVIAMATWGGRIVVGQMLCFVTLLTVIYSRAVQSLSWKERREVKVGILILEGEVEKIVMELNWMGMT